MVYANLYDDYRLIDREVKRASYQVGYSIMLLGPSNLSVAILLILNRRYSSECLWFAITGQTTILVPL